MRGCALSVFRHCVVDRPRRSMNETPILNGTEYSLLPTDLRYQYG